MSSKKKQLILIPEYLQKFSCIGHDCEDTCCRGWTISLDKKTYKSYKKSSNLKLKKLFEQNIVRNRNNPSDHYYAKIKMDEKRICPFLNENKLCKIHLEVGASFLSNTCYFYPRHAKKINNLLEVSASVSCPEITRLALLNHEPMGFIEIEENIARPYALNYSIEDTNSLNEENNPLHYFWTLRIFLISILQDRRYSMNERFLLLGLVFKKVSKLQESNQLKKLAEILEEYQTQFDNVTDFKKIINSTDNISIIPFPKDFLEKISDYNIIINFSNERYYECIIEINNGLKLSDNDIKQTEQIYMDSHKNYYEPYMKEKDYILENYIVNEVFKEMYPFAKLKSISESYLMLLTLYNVIRFHLIGISAYHKNLDDDIVLKMIQSFSRVILHHNYYLGLFKNDSIDSATENKKGI